MMTMNSLKQISFRTFRRHCIHRHHFDDENLDYCNLRAGVRRKGTDSYYDPVCKKSRDCRKWQHFTRISNKSDLKQISFRTFRKHCRSHQFINDVGPSYHVCRKRYGIPHPLGEGFYDSRCKRARDCYLWHRLTQISGPKERERTILSKVLYTQQNPKIKDPW